MSTQLFIYILAAVRKQRESQGQVCDVISVKWKYEVFQWPCLMVLFQGNMGHEFASPAGLVDLLGKVLPLHYLGVLSWPEQGLASFLLGIFIPRPPHDYHFWFHANKLKNLGHHTIVLELSNRKLLHGNAYLGNLFRCSSIQVFIHIGFPD